MGSDNYGDRYLSTSDFKKQSYVFNSDNESTYRWTLNKEGNIDLSIRFFYYTRERQQSFNLEMKKESNKCFRFISEIDDVYDNGFCMGEIPQIICDTLFPPHKRVCIDRPDLNFQKKYKWVIKKKKGSEAYDITSLSIQRVKNRPKKSIRLTISDNMFKLEVTASHFWQDDILFLIFNTNKDDDFYLYQLKVT